MSVQPFERREFSATATDSELVGQLAPDAQSFTISADGTGYPTGAIGPFLMVIDPDTSTEEKVLCIGRAGATFTIPLGGRGWEGTQNQNHDVGAKVRHCLGITDLDEANALVSMTLRLIAGRGTILVGSAPNTLVGVAPGTDGLAVVYDSSQPGGIKAAAPLPAVHDHSSNGLGGNIPQASVTGLPQALTDRVLKAGDTMTGLLVLSADPAVALGAATRQYVDNGLALKLNAGGGTLTGDLVLNDDTPDTAHSATSRQYVDNGLALKAPIASPVFTGTVTLPGNAASALQAVPKQQMDAADLGAIPALTPVVGTATLGPTSGTTELLLATFGPITGDGVTWFELEFDAYNFTMTITSDIFLVKLFDGVTLGSGTQLAQGLLVSQNSGANMGGCKLRALVQPSVGAHTYTARLVRSSGTGTAQMFGSSVAPSNMTGRVYR